MGGRGGPHSVRDGTVVIQRVEVLLRGVLVSVPVFGGLEHEGRRVLAVRGYPAIEPRLGPAVRISHQGPLLLSLIALN